MLYKMTSEEKTWWDFAKIKNPELIKKYIGVKFISKNYIDTFLPSVEYIPGFSLLWNDYIIKFYSNKLCEMNILSP